MITTMVIVALCLIVILLAGLAYHFRSLHNKRKEKTAMKWLIILIVGLLFLLSVLVVVGYMFAIRRFEKDGLMEPSLLD